MPKRAWRPNGSQFPASGRGEARKGDLSAPFGLGCSKSGVVSKNTTLLAFNPALAAILQMQKPSFRFGPFLPEYSCSFNLSCHLYRQSSSSADRSLQWYHPK